MVLGATRNCDPEVLETNWPFLPSGRRGRRRRRNKRGGRRGGLYGVQGTEETQDLEYPTKSNELRCPHRSHASKESLRPRYEYVLLSYPSVVHYKLSTPTSRVRSPCRRSLYYPPQARAQCLRVYHPVAKRYRGLFEGIKTNRSTQWIDEWKEAMTPIVAHQ